MSARAWYTSKIPVTEFINFKQSLQRTGRIVWEGGSSADYKDNLKTPTSSVAYFGNAGNDDLFGGSGRDYVCGGSGGIYYLGKGNAVIEDFKYGEKDKILVKGSVNQYQLVKGYWGGGSAQDICLYYGNDPIALFLDTTNVSFSRDFISV
jgi:Ca2+-binding RTX toxin-like protein